MYILTDQTREIIAVSLEAGQAGAVMTCLLPGPGQRLHHLPDVPEAIARLRDDARFASELTRYFRSCGRASEIDTIRGNAHLRLMRDGCPSVR